MTDLRQAIARIVDPHAWAGHDARINDAAEFEAIGSASGRDAARASAAAWALDSLAKADAILALPQIAAAPDLYEALVEAIANIEAREDALFGEEAFLHRARAALAKALPSTVNEEKVDG